MSSTSNAQDLLVNVFRPTYRWDSNTGFVPSLTISNVSEIITGSIKTDLLVVSDTGNNTYIGSNAGLYASNTSYNVGLGYQAMGGAINSSNNVAVGYYALDGAKNSTSNVVLGSYSGLTNSNGGVRNVLIGPNVTVGTGSGNILIGADISLASGTNRFQLGKLLYGDLSSGYIGVNTDDPKSAFDVSGTTLIRGKLGIQTVPNPKYSLDVNGSIFANDRFFGGRGTVAEPVYSFDDVSASGMYVPQASEGYGNGAFAIAVNQKPAAIFSSNAVNFFQNLDVSGTFSATNVELAAFSVEAGSRAAPTITFASNRADGFYHLADTSGFVAVTMGQDRMMFLESGDISSSRILGSDISLAGAIFTTAGCNVVGGVTLSNGNVILTGTATNSNLLVPGWIRNNETVPTVDISGGVVRALRFRAQDGSAGTPAYSFITDRSTGIHLEGTSQLAFDTAGVPRMVISNSNVGIGTTTPNSQFALDVSGGIRSVVSNAAVKINNGTVQTSVWPTAAWPGYAFVGDSSSGMYQSATGNVGLTVGGVRTAFFTSNRVAFDTCGSERMCISGQFVGIGTANPRVALEVVGDVSATTYNGPGGTAGAPHYTFSDDRTTGLFFPGANMIGMTAGGTERIRISNGFIGIGTTPSASSALDVSGVFRIIGRNGNITFDNGTIDVSGTPLVSTTGAFSNAATTSNVIGGVTLSNGFTQSGTFRGSNGSATVPTYSFISDPSTGFHRSGVSQIAFDTSGVQRMCISGGFVGIGTANPTFTLDVSGALRVIGGAGGDTTISNGRVFSSVSWSDTFTVAAGLGTNAIVRSADGLSWTPATSTAGLTGGRGVAWNGSLWVAVGTGTDTIATSTDGATWVGRGNSVVANGAAVAGNGNLWVAMSSSGTHSIATSTDGITWVGRGNSVLTTGTAIAWNGSLWVALGGGGGTHTIATSTNGINWIGRGNTIFTSTGFAVAWNGSIWVGVGEGTHTIATSTDGINWTGLGSSIFSTYGIGVAWNGNLWVAVGRGGNSFATSTDGVNWVGRGQSVLDTGAWGIAWNGARWVAAGLGTSFNLATSTDGINWSGVGASAFTTLGQAVAARVTVLPAISPTVLDASGGNVGYTGTLIGSNAGASNSIGGVALRNSTVFAGVGSAATPSYSFTSDPSTGLHRSGVGQLAFATGGINRMVINDASIGIGVSNPIWSLDISGSGVRKIQVSGQDAAVNVWDQRVANPAVLFQNASNYGVYSSNALPFWLWQSNRVGLSISGGCVGIGTTLPIGGFDISYASTTFPSFRVTNVPLPTQGWGGLNRHTVDISGGMRIVQDASLAGPTDNDPRALSDSLTLQSHRGQGSNGSASIVFRSGRDNAFYGRIYGIDRQPIPGNAFIGDLVFQTANGVGLPEVMRMTWDSRVGIRTNGPATTLDVSHDGLTGPGGFLLSGTRGVGIGLSITNGSKSLDLGIANNAGAWAGNSISGDAVLRTTARGRLLFNANGVGGTAALTISGDKVGIGCFNGDSPTGLLTLDVCGATRLGRSINGNNNLILIADTASGAPLTRHGIGMFNVSTGTGNGGNDLAFNTYNDAGQPLNTDPPAMLIKRSNGNVGILCNAPQYALDVSGTIGAHSNEYTVYVTSSTTVTAPTGFCNAFVTLVGGGGSGGNGAPGSGLGAGGGGGSGGRVSQLFVNQSSFVFTIGAGGSGGQGYHGVGTSCSVGSFRLQGSGGWAGLNGSGNTGGNGGGSATAGTSLVWGQGHGGGGGGALGSGNVKGSGGAGAEGNGTAASGAYAGRGSGNYYEQLFGASVAGIGGSGGGAAGGNGGLGDNGTGQRNGTAGGLGCGGGGGGAGDGLGGAGGNGYAIIKFMR
jgi:hypothetical protein